MGTLTKISVKETLQMQRIRKVQELLQSNVVTYKELAVICPRPDERADLVARMLAGGMVDATLYPIPLPKLEATHG